MTDFVHFKNKFGLVIKIDEKKKKNLMIKEEYKTH